MEYISLVCLDESRKEQNQIKMSGGVGSCRFTHCFVGSSSVWLVLGSDELGGCRDEAEGETGRLFPSPRQLGPTVHPEPQLQVAGGHTPHTHGTLPR